VSFETGRGPAESLGERIRRLRNARGLSLAKVGGKDFSRAFLSQVEKGRAQPSTRVLRIVAGRLDTPVDYLLEGRLPTVERELALERARVLLLRAHPKLALDALDDLDRFDWPVGTDARLCRAEALAALGRHEDAQKLLKAERRVIFAHRDAHRMNRWRALMQGEPFRVGGGDPKKAAGVHVRIADRAVRTGNSAEALDHYRAARVLLEA
jgi:transcriptional regulator with XRE-family HTH domain